MEKYYKDDKCQKCGRTLKPIKILEKDKKTGKKFYVITCSKCDYKYDVEEVK